MENRKCVIKPVKFNRKTLEKLDIDYDWVVNCKFLQTITMTMEPDWKWKNDKHTFFASVNLDLCTKADLVQLIGRITGAFERNFDNKPQMSFYLHDEKTAIIQIHLSAP